MTLSEDIQKLFVIAQYHVQDIFNLLADPETGFQNVLSIASHPSQCFCWCLVGKATVSTDKNAGILFHDKNPRIAKQPRLSCCLSSYGNSEPNRASHWGNLENNVWKSLVFFVVNVTYPVIEQIWKAMGEALTVQLRSQRLSSFRSEESRRADSVIGWCLRGLKEQQLFLFATWVAMEKHT